jgi:NAD(P)-dependent dehydrogenase (short-subunit alcohol dehydrogenase family)
MSCPYKLTTDGFETQWQVNYLAPFVMTTFLMPLMLSTAAKSDSKTRVRIVNVSSALAFSNPKTIDFEDPNLTNASGMLENQ